MLDQRRAIDKGYITLKEAAKIANYSPDYVGQLIRAGKIHGEQVYASTAWVTTPDEVLAYLENKQRIVSRAQWFKFTMLRMKSSIAVYVFIALCTVSVLLMQYILYTSMLLSTTEHFNTDFVDTNDSITVALSE